MAQQNSPPGRSMVARSRRVSKRLLGALQRAKRYHVGPLTDKAIAKRLRVHGAVQRLSPSDPRSHLRGQRAPRPVGKRARMDAALERIGFAMEKSPGTRWVPNHLHARIQRVKRRMEHVATTRNAYTAKSKGGRIIRRLKSKGGWYPIKGKRKPYRPDLMSALERIGEEFGRGAVVAGNWRSRVVNGKKTLMGVRGRLTYLGNRAKSGNQKRRVQEIVRRIHKHGMVS